MLAFKKQTRSLNQKKTHGARSYILLANKEGSYYHITSEERGENYIEKNNSRNCISMS
jgi:hypothetical protein